MRRSLWVKIMACWILSGVLVCGCGPQGGDGKPGGTKAPGFVLKDLEGRVHRLDDFQGKVVILNFFATWCAPCQMEIPILVQLHQSLGHKGLGVIGVSMDEGGQSVLAPFIRKHGIHYPVALATREIIRDYGGIQGIPHTFLIDDEGMIRQQFVGMVPGHQIESSVRKLLKGRG